MSNIKNYGIRGIGADVQLGKGGGRLKYNSGSGRFEFVQGDGTTLEEVQFGTVSSGAWQGTAIGTEYGGLGGDFSSSTGFLKVTSGSVAANASINLDSDVSGTLPIGSSGTGAGTAAGARIALGLGNVATQNNDSVNFDGGSIDGVAIGSANPSTAEFTTLEFGTSLSDGTITITGFVDEDNMSSNSATLVPTQQSVKAYVDSSVAASGGALSFSGDSGNGTINFTTETLGIVGTTNEIVTSVSGNDVIIGLPDDVTIGNDLTITGNLTVNGTTTTVNTEEIALSDNIIVLNSGETGTPSQNAGIEVERGTSLNTGIRWNETSDVWEITENGTNYYRILTVNDEGSGNGIDADQLDGQHGAYYLALSNATGDTDDVTEGSTNLFHTTSRARNAISASGDISYNSTTGVISFSETYSSASQLLTALITVDGASSGLDADLLDGQHGAYYRALSNATGDTDDVTEGSTNLYFTNARARDAISASGNISYDSATGVISFTERTPTEIRGLFSVTGDLTYNDSTGVFSFTERSNADVRGLFGASGDLAYNSSTGVFSFSERTDSEVRALFSASGGITYNSSTGAIGQNLDTDDITEGSSNLYYTTARANSAIDARVNKSFVDALNVDADTLDGVQGSNYARTDVAETFDANVTVGGTIIADSLVPLSGSEFTADGDFVITGNVVIQGSSTILDTTNLGVEDALIELARNQTSGGLDSGLIVNRGSASDVFIGWDESVDTVVAALGNLDANASTALTFTGYADFRAGDAQFASLTFGNGSTVDIVRDEDNMSSNDPNALATQQSIKAYVDSSVNGLTPTANIAGDSGTGTVNLETQSLTISGTTNEIVTSASGQTVTIGLPSAVSGLSSLTATTLTGTTVTDGTASLSTGNFTGLSSLSTSNLQINGSTGITSVDTDLSSVSGSDNSLASAKAIKDYVDNNSGDGLVIHGSVTHSAGTTLGTVPNVSGRTYRAHKIIVDVTTAFSGGSFSYITVTEGGGSGTVLLDEPDCDAGATGTYVIDVPATTLTKNQSVVVAFRQAGGSTASPTAGAMTVSVHYTWD